MDSLIPNQIDTHNILLDANLETHNGFDTADYLLLSPKRATRQNSYDIYEKPGGSCVTTAMGDGSN